MKDEDGDCKATFPESPDPQVAEKIIGPPNFEARERMHIVEGEEALELTIVVGVLQRMRVSVFLLPESGAAAAGRSARIGLIL